MTTPGETPSSQAPLVEGEIPDSARIEAIMAEVVKDLASAAETAPVQATIVETHPPESAAAPSVPAPTPEPAHAETPAETSRQASPAPSPPAPESQAAQPPPEPINGPSVIPIDIIPPPAATITTPGTTPGEAAAQETPAPPSVREPETAALPATPAPPSASESTPESQAATPATPAPGGGEEKGRIVVRAKMNSWIQVRDDTVNELLFTRMLRVGDSYAVPGRPGLKLSTGNAGALEILVDGEPVPSIGGEGTVRRNVILDAERLKAGTAVGK
jgi:cytoskeleton protein RodZ